MPAQPHITRNAATTRLNSWLLLWLVPWLFFSVASGGLHDHYRHSAALHREKPCVQAKESPGGVKNATPGYAQAVTGSAAHHDCPACRWNAQAVLKLSIAGVLSTPVLQPVPAQPQTFVAPTSLALPALRGRGPPSL